MAIWNNFLERQKLFKWGSKGLFAILDQGVFSGGNFIVNVFLARWLSEANYGAFSASFIVYLFISGFYNAIILEPISVIGTGRYSENLREYLWAQFSIHFLLTAVFGLLLAAISYFISSLGLIGGALVNALYGVAVFVPFMLLLWFVRRIFYILQKPLLSFGVSFSYTFGLIGSLLIVSNFLTEELNLFVVYILYGLASLLGVIVFLLAEKIGNHPVSNNNFSTMSLLKEQWLFGRWLSLGNLFYFIAYQIQFIIVGIFLGLNGSGVYRAMQNVSLPIMQTITAVSIFILPIVAFEFGKENYKRMKVIAFRVSFLLFILSSAYFLCLYLYPEMIETILFGGKYEENIWLIPLFAIAPIIFSFEVGFSLINRSIQKPFYHTIVNGITAFVGIVSALVFVSLWEIKGAIYSLIVIQMVSFFVNLFFYRKWFLEY